MKRGAEKSELKRPTLTPVAEGQGFLLNRTSI